MKTYLSRRATTGTLLALTLALGACQDRGTDEIGAAGAAGGGVSTTAPYETDGASAGRVVAVSVTSAGTLMPSFPAGLTTFTVQNGGTEDCALTLTPRGPAGTGADGMTDGTEPGTAAAGTSNQAAAGRATTLTRDLRPGTYEISCASESGQARPSAGAPMLIVVTGEGTTVTATGATGTGAAGAGGTDVGVREGVTTGSGARSGSDGMNDGVDR